MKRFNNSSGSTIYMIRIFAGFYLLYIDYTLLKDWQRLNNKILFTIFMIVFAVFGLLLIGYSIKGMLQKKSAPIDDETEVAENKKPDDQKLDDKNLNNNKANRGSTISEIINKANDKINDTDDVKDNQ